MTNIITNVIKQFIEFNLRDIYNDKLVNLIENKKVYDLINPDLLGNMFNCIHSNEENNKDSKIVLEFCEEYDFYINFDLCFDNFIENVKDDNYEKATIRFYKAINELKLMDLFQKLENKIKMLLKEIILLKLILGKNKRNLKINFLFFYYFFFFCLESFN